MEYIIHQPRQGVMVIWESGWGMSQLVSELRIRFAVG